MDLSESENGPINQSTTTSELIIYQSATTSDEKNNQFSTTPTLDMKKNLNKISSTNLNTPMNITESSNKEIIPYADEHFFHYVHQR